jgi:hypothetical protein
MIIVERENVVHYDRTEQARLALALVDSLGLDGAIFACRANSWDGVLKLLVGGGGNARRRLATPLSAVHA